MLILLMPECRISFCFFLFSSISFFMLVLFSELYVTPGCVGSRLLSRIFSSCSEQGLPSGCGARVSCYSSSFLCGARAPGRAGGSGCSLWAPWLQSTGFIAVVQGLTCLAACSIFQDEGLNSCLLRWQLDSLQLSNQGSPHLQLLSTMSYSYQVFHLFD